MFEKVAGVNVLVGIEVRNRGRVGCLSTDFVVTKTLQEVNALKGNSREKRPRNRDTSQRSNFSS